MTFNRKRIDLLRRSRSEAENHLIDGLLAGRVDRRDFLRHGSVLGLSLPLLGSIAGVAGLGLPARQALAAGGTIRVAQVTPAASMDPVQIADSGGITTLSQCGEYLCWSGADLMLQPQLAESWSPNADGSVWTFALRRGVKFHNGAVMTADDVVASINRLADPENGSNALSAFSGVLSAGGARKVDDHTVEFVLDAPNGNFPYYLSSDNYNAVILPAEEGASFEENWIATGPFRLESYTPQVGAKFVRFEDYWGPKALPDRVEMKYYGATQPQILALQGGEVDVILQAPVLQSVALLNDPNIQIIGTPSASHQQVHMRTDTAPFQDARVRRAVALCLDRDTLVQGLMRGRAEIGNDSPFAPAFPSTDTAVAQRQKNVEEAKALMQAAGMADGFDVTLTTMDYIELPQYAVLIQNAVKEIGGRINIELMDQGAYYGEAVYGNSPWLDSVMGITDYGHRGVPNVYLSAPLASTGTWNSAHFANPTYDSLVKSYIASLDLESQKESAGQIQRLLLEETPILFTYFFEFLTATRAGMQGVAPTAMGHIRLDQAAA